MNRRNFLKASIGLPFISLTTVGLCKESSSEVKVKIFGYPTKPQSNLPDLSLLLHCIAEVETGNNDSIIGPHGERSRYQIKFLTWTQWTELPFISATRNPSAARTIAGVHLHWLHSSFRGMAQDSTNISVYRLAWCWHGGLSSWAVLPVKRTIELASYSQRVTNLYVSYLSKPLP